MFKLKRGYFYAAILLIISIGCIISSCGGGSNNGTLPVTNTNASIDSTPSVITFTPTPVLIQKPIQGYIYGNNITTDDGETVPRINVLDVPACQADSSGNEPFVTQVANSLQQDYPEDWAKEDVQELYAQLSKTLSESKPLLEYNAQAQLCSAYDDTSIPIGSNGHFDNTVLTGATDSNVKLEVALGEDNYTEVETLPSSGNINSSDATSAAVLKSCPEKIFAFPGEIIIFKVYSEPGINLKSAGLKFTLNNTSMGCITQPVYLCLFGAHKYQVAYGCVYIKHGLDTPVDTTITAKLNSGQSMNIFLEVIKKTASVSGTVYTGGSSLVKGYVKSLGPKACCKIDSSGQYSLPKVFMGHSRSVIATWWTSENGHKVRHREEKIIDFLSGDLTGFNFGVPPTPTPTATPTATPTTRHPGDSFYDARVSEVFVQFEKWESEIGFNDAVKKTENWLKGNLPSEIPVPQEIVGANLGPSPSTELWIDFVGGNSVCLQLSPRESIRNLVNPDLRSSISSSMDFQDSVKRKSCLQNSNISPVISPNRRTTASSNVLIISSLAHEAQGITDLPRGTNIFEHRVYSDLEQKLRESGYTVVSKVTTDQDITWDTDLVYAYNNLRVMPHKIKPGHEGNIVHPTDYINLDNYGVIYINTHGINGTGVFDPNIPATYEDITLGDGILACNYCENDTILDDWVEEQIKKWPQYKFVPSPEDPDKPDFNDRRTYGNWCIHYGNVFYDTNGIAYVIRYIRLTRAFFKENVKKPENAIIYMDSCFGWKLRDIFSGNGNVYLSHTWTSHMQWAGLLSYYYFYYIMYGYMFNEPVLIPPGNPASVTSPIPNRPLSVRESYNLLNQFKVNPDPYNYELA